MAEKVIHEVRVVETETGYRIEINGDKERMKEMFGKRGFGGPWGHHGFGPAGFRGPWGHGFGRHFARHLRRHAWGPWGWDEEDEEDEPQRGPAADKGPDAPKV
jgi:hypothetical protein